MRGFSGCQDGTSSPMDHKIGIQINVVVLPPLCFFLVVEEIGIRVTRINCAKCTGGSMSVQGAAMSKAAKFLTKSYFYTTAVRACKVSTTGRDDYSSSSSTRYWYLH